MLNQHSVNGDRMFIFGEVRKVLLCIALVI